jgi:hypothetical protein
VNRLIVFWLTYQTPRGTQVFIADAGFLMMAKVKAGIAGQKGEFQKGHKIDAKTEKKITAKMIGRTLSHKEVFSLLKRIT